MTDTLSKENSLTKFTRHQIDNEDSVTIVVNSVWDLNVYHGLLMKPQISKMSIV